MKITSITPRTIDRIRDDINKAIASTLNDLGIEGNLGKARYDDNTVSFNVEFKLEGTLSRSDKSKNQELELWLRMNPDIDPNKVGEYNGGQYALTGVSFRSRKYPILVQAMGSGRSYKFTESQAKKMFRKEGSRPPSDLYQQAEKMWYKDWQEQGSEDVGSCCLGKGIAIRGDHDKWGNGNNVVKCSWVQGNISASRSVKRALAFLQKNGVDCYYNDGRID
tara:strand:- start:737 stop:1399 length:663 start_codon:yes stop_codon:yes gene_type:complete